MRKALFILGSLNDVDVDWLINNGSKKDLSVGDTLIQAGQSHEYLFIITAGELAVVLPQAANKEIASLKAGEIVGEMSFIDSAPPTVSVIAKKRSTLLAISRKNLKAKIETDPAFGKKFYFAIATFLSDRLRKTVSNLGYGSVEEEEENDPDEIDFNVMENLHLAGARFDTIMKKLSEI